MMKQSTLLTPILLEGSLHETIWGGEHLATVAGKRVAMGATIGESWETEVSSRVRNAPFAGETLGALVDRYGEDLLGWRAMAVFGPRFPLLTKFIDAQQRLSVQVHPSDTYAAAHEGGKRGKTECWYILQAEPGARLVYGLKRSASREEVQRAIAETRLEALLQTVEARVGDIFFVPAGTIHAIGEGIVLYELQEYSDVTYRLYDYGRRDSKGNLRELHVERALDVMDYIPPVTIRSNPLELGDGEGMASRRVLVACEYFVLEELQLTGRFAADRRASSCEILTLLDGAATLRCQGVPLELAQGDTVVLPASLVGYGLEGGAGRIVRSYVPTEDDAVVPAWQEAQRSAPLD